MPIVFYLLEFSYLVRLYSELNTICMYRLKCFTSKQGKNDRAKVCGRKSRAKYMSIEPKVHESFLSYCTE